MTGAGCCAKPGPAAYIENNAVKRVRFFILSEELGRHGQFFYAGDVVRNLGEAFATNGETVIKQVPPCGPVMPAIGAGLVIRA